MLWEKENYNYLEILKVNTMKQAEMKKRQEKSNSDKQENFSILSSAAKISLKK